MKKKIVGIFVCMLMIGTVLPVLGALNSKTTWYQKENTFSNLQTIPAESGMITINLRAKVKVVYDPNNLLGGVIQVNDTITGKYKYDSGTPDNSSDPNAGIYLHKSSSFGFEVKAGGLTFKTNPSDVYFYILIHNDVNHPPLYDLYFVYSLHNLQLTNGMLCTSISWELIDYNCTAISSDALPVNAPVLSDWIQPIGLALNGKNPSNPSQVFHIFAEVIKATKSRAVDIHGKNAQLSTSPMITTPYLQQKLFMIFLERLFERFPNAVSIHRHLMRY